LIDTIMKAMLNDSSFGMWNEIKCVKQPESYEYFVALSNPSNFLTGVQGWTQVQGSDSMMASCDVIPGPGMMGYDCTEQKEICTGNYGAASVSADGSTVTCLKSQYTATNYGGGDGIQCDPGNSACSVSALQEAGLSATQANIMSCIAMTESSGNPTTPPYNLSHPGSNSSACGTFQVVHSTWSGAASGACSDFSQCTNASCNIQVMTTLVHQSGYSSWTCPNCNAKASGCIAKFGG